MMFFSCCYNYKADWVKSVFTKAAAQDLTIKAIYRHTYTPVHLWQLCHFLITKQVFHYHELDDQVDTPENMRTHMHTQAHVLLLGFYLPMFMFAIGSSTWHYHIPVILTKSKGMTRHIAFTTVNLSVLILMARHHLLSILICWITHR